MSAPKGKLPKELEPFRAELFQMTIGKEVAVALFELLRKPNKLDDWASQELRSVRKGLARWLGRDENETKA